jgi:nucleoside-diphosphate-sugar epimerase
MTDAMRNSDCVFHLATLFKGNHDSNDVRSMVESNVGFTAEILDAGLRAEVKNFVYTESIAQHLSGSEYSPTSLYAATKQAGTDIIRYFTTVGINAICLTIPDTMGPKDSRGKLLELLVKTSAEQSTLQMSPGEQLVDYLYISDVISGLLRSAEILNEGIEKNLEFFRLSSQNLVTLKTFVSEVSRHLTDPPKIIWGAKEYRNGEIFDDISWPPHLHGWQPVVNLSDGIQYSIEETHYEK